MATPKEVRAQVENAIDELNRTHFQSEKIRIVWGNDDVEDEKFVKRVVKQDALLNISNTDFELVLLSRPDLDDFHWFSLYIALIQQRLPKEDPRRLYNVFRSCDKRVQPMLFRGDENEILVVGVLTSFPVNAITATMLSVAITGLLTSTASVYRWLTGSEEEGATDPWERDREGVESNGDA